MDCPDRFAPSTSSTAAVLEAECDQTSETFFSTRSFVEAVSRTLGVRHHALAIPVQGSGPPRTMYAIQTLGRYGLPFVSLAPFGLYASPGWNGQIEIPTLQGILYRLKRGLTRGFVWNARFDHQSLAGGLISLGVRFQRTTTHVLHLEQGYEHVFSRHTGTMRNKIRKARRMGVLVRDVHDAEDINAYYRIHTQLAQQKGGYGSIYPARLFLELVNVPGAVRLLLAECEGRIAAGGLFFRDGCSVMYWHGATDRDYSHFYPSYAIFDEAIRWACEIGATFVNFGGSAGIASLEQFKSSWGARPERNWEFTWMNPFWAHLSRLKAKIVSRHA